jgi:acyl dehydratase
MPLDRYEVVAHNTATQSANKIHDDAVAKNLGFKGGLVPGVDVAAYLTHLPAANWGRSWLDGGAITVRFDTPVYDGDRITVRGDAAEEAGDGLALTLVDSSAATCATGVAERSSAEPPPALDAIPVAPLPGERRMASPEVFASFPDGVLGTSEYGFHAEAAESYLADVREILPLYRDERVAHPGWLLRMANWALTTNVLLGPWIHVGSALHLHGAIEDGQRISVRARVADVSDRKGHGFVELDVLYVVDDHRVAASCHHTAIYEPRGVRG